MRTGKLLAIFGLIASTFAIFIRVMTPTVVQFIIEGNVVELIRVPNIYNSLDMAVTSVSCFVRAHYTKRRSIDERKMG